MPTFPAEVMMKAVEVPAGLEEVETAKSGTVDDDEVAETESRANGVVVPIPTLEVEATMNWVSEVEPMTNEGPLPNERGLMANEAHGEVVPIPTPRFLTLPWPSDCPYTVRRLAPSRYAV